MSQTPTNGNSGKGRTRRGNRGRGGNRGNRGGVPNSSDGSEKITVRLEERVHNTGPKNSGISGRAHARGAHIIQQDRMSSTKSDLTHAKKLPMLKGNRYSSAMVFPDKYGDGAKIPDDFCNKTYSFKVKISSSVPTINSGLTTPIDYSYNGNNNFATGRLMLHAYRTLLNPYRFITAYNIQANATAITYNTTVRNQTALQGLWLVDGTPAAAVQGQMIANSGQQYNLVGPISLDTSTTSEMAVFPFRNYQSNGSAFFGHSLNFQNSSAIAAGTITVTLTVGGIGPSITSGLAINLCDSTGSIGSKTLTFVPNTTMTATFSATDIGSYINGGDWRGDRMFGVQFVIAQGTSTVSQEYPITNFSMVYNFPAGNNFPQLNWKSLNWEDASNATKNFRSFRVVAQATWVKWIGGSGFNDTGGLISAALYSGGDPVLYAGNDVGSLLWTEQGLRSTEYAYCGEVDRGTYGFSPPKDYDSITFEPSGTVYPYIDNQHFVVASVNPPQTGVVVPANLLTLKCTMVYEVTTSKAWLITSDSPVDRGQMQKVKQMFKEYKGMYFCSNDTHDEVMKWASLPADVLVANFAKLKDPVRELLPLLAFM